MTLSIAVIGLLLCFSAFFSGTETALFSLQAIDRETLKKEGRSGQRILALLADPRRTLASLLMGNELVNISLSSVCAGLILAWQPERAWLNLFLATPMLIFFGEITPKVVALRNARRWALAVGAPFSLWARAITPLRWVLTSLADLAIGALGVGAVETEELLEEDQVRKLIDQGHEAGTIRSTEHRLIHRVFAFGDMPVSRLCTPRPDIVSFPLNVPYDTLLEEIRRTRLSRLPIYTTNRDNIIGILHSRDLLSLRGGPPPGPRELKLLLHKAYFVPQTNLAGELLKEFQRQQVHLALTVDEHGSVTGLVTLDDLLTELVGRELDEDEPNEEISRIRDDMWTVPGSMDIEDFDEQTGISLPDGDYNTLAGYLLATLGHIPTKGESVVFDGVTFSVARMEGRRVAEITVRTTGEHA